MRKLFIVSAIVIVCLFSGCDLLLPKDDLPESSSKTLNLTVGSSTSADVIAEMGAEPYEYRWGTTVYTKETLPYGSYLMNYGSDLSNLELGFGIDNSQGNHVLFEARIYEKGVNYSCMNGALRIGTSLENALIALGAPSNLEIIDGQPKPQSFDHDVLYTNINGTSGYHYYANTAHGIRM
jgi:hypothetical protein